MSDYPKHETIIEVVPASVHIWKNGYDEGYAKAKLENKQDLEMLLLTHDKMIEEAYNNGYKTSVTDCAERGCMWCRERSK